MTSTDAKQPLRVGLIGFGLGGATFHAPFIGATPGLELAGVMTRDPARRDTAAREYPHVTIADDLEALLRIEPTLDLIVISTPNATHAPLAREALEAGRHVVVDKPFASTAAEAREIGALAERVGKLAIPFQNRRWDGDFLTLQRLLRDGALGEPFRFESRLDRWRPTPKPGWTKPDARENNETIVYDLGTHLVDQALVLFGPVARVYAEARHRHPEVVTEDDVFIALTHENGVSSHLYMSTMAGVAGPRIMMFGSRGAYLKAGVDVQEAALRAGERPGSPGFGEEPRDKWGTLGTAEASEPVPTARGDYGEFYAGVVRAIGDGAQPPVLVEEVAAGLEILEQVTA